MPEKSSNIQLKKAIIRNQIKLYKKGHDIIAILVKLKTLPCSLLNITEAQKNLPVSESPLTC